MAMTRTRPTLAEAFSDPLRVRLVERLMDEPLTAKELGPRVGVEPNRIYYHLKLLETAGLITVDSLRPTARGAERVYRISEGTTDEDPSAQDVLAIAMSLFSATQMDLQRRLAGDETNEALRFRRISRSIPKKKWAEFITAVDKLLDELDESTGRGPRYTVLFGAFEAEPEC